MSGARETLREFLAANLTTANQGEASKLIAKYVAEEIRKDRLQRRDPNLLVKLADVFFNGRPA